MRLNNVSKIWWLNPIIIYFGWTIFTLYCSSIDSKKFNDMYEEYIYIYSYNIFLYFLFFLFFCIGYSCYKSKCTVIHLVYNYNISTLKKTYYLLYWITISAYIIWTISLVLNFGTNIFYQIALNFINPEYGILDSSNKGGISGVTTFTEFGIVVGPLNVYLICLTHKKLYKRMFCALLFLSILRAAIFSERLAFLEIAIPSFVVYSYFGKIFRSKYIKLIPIIAFLGLFFVFGLFEYFRSWGSYKNAYNDDFTAFVIDRVFGYYSIAINTESIQANFVGPRNFPLQSFEWFWTLPVLKNIPDYFMSSHKIDYLRIWGNPEFNNPGGLLFAYKDLGFFGLIFQLFFGWFVAYVYKGFCRHGLISSIWYSVTFLCMIELPRYFFWGSPRAFFVIVAIMILQYRLKPKYNVLHLC